MVCTAHANVLECILCMTLTLPALPPEVLVTCMTTFTCLDGSVHPWARRCDGIKDCRFFEDEMECDGKVLLYLTQVINPQ